MATQDSLAVGTVTYARNPVCVYEWVSRHVLLTARASEQARAPSLLADRTAINIDNNTTSPELFCVQLLVPGPIAFVILAARVGLSSATQER